MEHTKTLITISIIQIEILIVQYKLKIFYTNFNCYCNFICNNAIQHNVSMLTYILHNILQI